MPCNHPDHHLHSCPLCLCLVQKHTWTKGLTLRNFEDHQRANERLVEEIKDLSSESWLASCALH